MSKTIGDLDRTDRQILAALQANGRLTGAELAEQVSLSPSPCWRRVQMLEQAGYIQGYRAQLDRKMLGLDVHGFVCLKMKDHSLTTGAAFERAVVALEGAVACQNLSGNYDYQIELVANDHEAFARLIREIRALLGVADVYTSFTLREIKVRGSLPVSGGIR